jgi:hypothetical protein
MIYANLREQILCITAFLVCLIIILFSASWILISAPFVLSQQAIQDGILIDIKNLLKHGANFEKHRRNTSSNRST